MKNTIIMLIIILSITNSLYPYFTMEELSILQSNDLTKRNEEIKEYLGNCFRRSYYNSDLKCIANHLFERAKQTPEYTSFNQADTNYKTVHNEMLANNCFNISNYNTPDCERLKKFYEQVCEEQKKLEEEFQKTPEMQAKLKIQQCIDSNQRIQKMIEEEQKQQRKILMSLIIE